VDREKSLQVVNPATGQRFEELTQCEPGQLKELFENARVAQQDWAGQSLQERKKVLERYGALLHEQYETLAGVLSGETGKPIQQAKTEIRATRSRVDFFLARVDEVLADELVLEDAKQRIQEGITRDALGVIANISAWNYPYFIGSNVFVPALLTGNAVLYKPSEFAPRTGLEIARLLSEAGLPEHLFQTIVGTGKIAEKLFDLDIQGVFFTGSYVTGCKVAQAAASKLIKVQLELGGKDPIYVCQDVDLQITAEGVAEGAFYNSGQSCCAVERIYVHEAVYDEFVGKFCDVVSSYKVGDPKSEDTFIGPLTRAAQLDVLEAQARDAEAKGAHRAFGTGQRLERDGNYFDPTVYSKVDHSMDLMKEESFGPIIGIQRVMGDDEAIELMSDTQYGLTSGVFCINGARAEKILGALNSGTVYWNCADRVSPRLPWSGRGHSGLGVTLSKEGIRCFTQPKAWHWRSPG
jgi:acyl-CoA reductase-like NAD-dependent aldehyde dehydrogenase